MNAGKPPQHTAEVERELDKADNVIRLLFNDVQVLKDGRHPQAEQMYRRWVPHVLHLTFDKIHPATKLRIQKNKIIKYKALCFSSP